jgi:DNA-binding Xre family transcriptional regulator
MPFDPKAVGLKIKHILLDKESTIAALAERLGISRQGLYWKISNGSWTAEDIHKVAEVLQVNPKDLI